MTERERRTYYFSRGKRQVELSQKALCEEAVDAHTQLAEAYFLLAQGLSLDETKRRVSVSSAAATVASAARIGS